MVISIWREEKTCQKSGLPKDESDSPLVKVGTTFFYPTQKCINLLDFFIYLFLLKDKLLYNINLISAIHQHELARDVLLDFL